MGWNHGASEGYEVWLKSTPLLQITVDVPARLSPRFVRAEQRGVTLLGKSSSRHVKQLRLRYFADFWPLTNLEVWLILKKFTDLAI